MALRLEELKRKPPRSKISPALRESPARSEDSLEPPAKLKKEEDFSFSLLKSSRPQRKSFQFPWAFPLSAPSSSGKGHSDTKSNPYSEPRLWLKARYLPLAYLHDSIRINRRRLASGKGLTLLSPFRTSLTRRENSPS